MTIQTVACIQDVLSGFPSGMNTVLTSRLKVKRPLQSCKASGLEKRECNLHYLWLDAHTTLHVESRTGTAGLQKPATCLVGMWLICNELVILPRRLTY
jgi:hypothetical protein